jgi:hypothetical protein
MLELDIANVLSEIDIPILQLLFKLLFSVWILYLLPLREISEQ